MPVLLLLLSLFIWLCDLIRNPNVDDHLPPSERYRRKFMRDC